MFLGIEDHVWILSIVVGALVATSVNQMRPKNHIPLAEIYLKKGVAIIWFVDANDTWWPWTLKKSKNGYFAMYTQRVKGIFHINTKHRFYMGGSAVPNYLISVRDMNSYNAVDVGLVNDFLDKNGISKMERKHISQAKKLRMIISKYFDKKGEKPPEKIETIAHDELTQISHVEKEVMQDQIKNGIKSYEDNIIRYNEEKNTNLEFDERTAMVFLVDYMLKHDTIDDVMATEFIFKIENGLVNLEGLKEKLRDVPVVEITHSMDVGIQRIVEEFGSQNPLELTGIIDDARNNIKELKKMTPVPVKQFIPGGVILAIGIVGILAMVLISNGSISGDMLGNLNLPGFP